MLRRTSLAVVAIAMMVMVGCAFKISKPWSEWTPKQKATYAQKVYNTQYADVKNMAALPNITDAQKKVVRTKKSILTKMRPILVIYVETVEAGGIPDGTTEEQMLKFINDLTGVIGG
jgi:hypothetical protein